MAKVTLVSYGKKHGSLTTPPPDLVLDATMLRNPFGKRHLHDLNGKHPDIHKFVSEDPAWGPLIRRVVREAADCAVIGVYCMGGNHRSVAVVEEAAKVLTVDGYEVEIIHRNIKE